MNPRAQAAYDERRIEAAEAADLDRYVDDDEGFARRAAAYWSGRLGVRVQHGTTCRCDGKDAVLVGFTTGFVLVEVAGLVRPVQPAGRVTFEEVAA